MSEYASLIRENLPTELLDLLVEAARLADNERQGIVLVGGVVRDMMTGLPAGEVDLMLDPPVRPIVEAMTQLVSGKLVSHESFHTFTIHFPDGVKLDVVTAREETYKNPAALPDVSLSTVAHDLKRRDFSVNAMALWLNSKKFGELLDPFNGASDLKKRLVRVLHPLSFVDDPTRIYRAARFAGRFNFQIEEETQKYILKAISFGVPSHLSAVRRRHEFELILKEANPVPALKFLQKWGAMSFIHPDWELRPEHEKSLSASFPTTSMDVLTYRLVEWFKPWGLERTKNMLVDLAFEKNVKKRVLMELELFG